ncbi:tRNA-guanine transglycosylase DpdA [Blastopirellula marina]|uniref:tRNA-guanine(15) transglycosylase-like domain-containing protein n=1 Tax=Blastopirellula marina DSM 3645 TaxID=314230 RepID=A3ZSB0_9BACT|nr:tRNA-guanine transglycosylase DpdA [Blastopirellula marina]EAQ80570.1 hypothetical protein DSM3645_14530 [Blastopirellula marina DSM 3645]
MEFFFPDSQDLVDPSFDFVTEKRSDTRIRQRDDLYAHEVYKKPPYDGMLVSKAIVEGTGAGTGRYTLGQQRRFAVEGVKEFLRIPPGMKVIGDCGAFTYVKEPVPPVTVDDVIRFYQDAGFDYGASIDHIILQYNPDWDSTLPGIDAVPKDCVDRQELTLELARAFIQTCRKERVCFEPLGIVQGWSPKSYSRAFSALQKMGYKYIAIGGLVPLKSREIMEILEPIAPKLKSDTRLHLFGVTRLDHVKQFAKHGVVSFDSTSPLFQAFKEDKENYYGKDRNYAAIRVPQVDVNVKLKNRILSGEVKQSDAFRLERECMQALQLFDKRRFPRADLIELLIEYQALFGSIRNYATEYEATLRDRPWKECKCTVCEELGINVLIFRGAERNRRRGFHNVFVTHNRLKKIRSRIAVA